MTGELYAGFQGGKKYLQNTDDLKQFMKKDGIRILNVTIETAEIFGELKADKRPAYLGRTKIKRIVQNASTLTMLMRGRRKRNGI